MSDEAQVVLEPEIDEDQFNRETRRRHFTVLQMDQRIDDNLQRVAVMAVTMLAEMTLKAAQGDPTQFPFATIERSLMTLRMQAVARAKIHSIIYPLVAGKKTRPKKIEYTVRVKNPSGDGPNAAPPPASGVPVAETPPDTGGGDGGAGPVVVEDEDPIEALYPKSKDNVSTAVVQVKPKGPPPAEIPPPPPAVSDVLSAIDAMGDEDE